jgi:hypothetical protein
VPVPIGRSRRRDTGAARHRQRQPRCYDRPQSSSKHSPSIHPRHRPVNRTAESSRLRS